MSLKVVFELSVVFRSESLAQAGIASSSEGYLLARYFFRSIPCNAAHLRDPSIVICCGVLIAGYHVFSLCVDQIFTVKYIFSGSGISRKCNSGSRSVHPYFRIPLPVRLRQFPILRGSGSCDDNR